MPTNAERRAMTAKYRGGNPPRPVACDDGRIFCSMADAGRAMGISGALVWQAVTKGCQANGHSWRLAEPGEEPNQEPVPPKSREAGYITQEMVRERFERDIRERGRQRCDGCAKWTRVDVDFGKCADGYSAFAHDRCDRFSARRH